MDLSALATLRDASVYIHPTLWSSAFPDEMDLPAAASELPQVKEILFKKALSLKESLEVTKALAQCPSIEIITVEEATAEQVVVMAESFACMPKLAQFDLKARFSQGEDLGSVSRALTSALGSRDSLRQISLQLDGYQRWSYLVENLVSNCRYLHTLSLQGTSSEVLMFLHEPRRGGHENTFVERASNIPDISSIAQGAHIVQGLFCGLKKGGVQPPGGLRNLELANWHLSSCEDLVNLLHAGSNYGRGPLSMLQDLAMTNCNLRDTDLLEMADALLLYKYLSVLNLSSNALTNECVYLIQDKRGKRSTTLELKVAKTRVSLSADDLEALDGLNVIV